MTPHQFDELGFGGQMWAIHKGVRKFVISVDFQERLFGLLPERPKEFTDYDWRSVEWVRCENVSDVYRPEVVSLNRENKQ
ncbi:hypothetical protein QTU67_003386 [Vibrio cholerae]|nr:hypothetical protein [Vibrio cholerae]